jgi:hypothetical protein
LVNLALIPKSRVSIREQLIKIGPAKLGSSTPPAVQFFRSLI